MAIMTCKHCAYWHYDTAADIVYCEHGRCYTKGDSLSRCYTTKQERFEKRQQVIQFEN